MRNFPRNGVNGEVVNTLKLFIQKQNKDSQAKSFAFENEAEK